MRSFERILVTGGAGFIGCNFIRMLLSSKEFEGKVVNLDLLTYSGNPKNLEDISAGDNGRYEFVHGSICDKDLVQDIFHSRRIDAVANFAAETHVDRSIDGPEKFIQTNVLGMSVLLQAARSSWNGSFEGKVFHHVSTDEVYGSLPENGFFYESTGYDPRSPYAASKAASDHLAKSWFHTFGLPVTITNCSNNYGPYQFPEKFIPVVIDKILNGQPIPVYGDGKNVRDWLFVDDHNQAIWQVMQTGSLGETYNVGGENEWENIKLVEKLCEIVATETGKDPEEKKKLITFVSDRPGHDRRYAINCDKLKQQLGWKPCVSFEKGLKKTVQWYLENQNWMEAIKNGDYRQWMIKNYDHR